LNNRNVRRYFDNRAHGYFCNSNKGLWNTAKQREKSAILRILEPERKDLILDAGCGSGYYLSALAEDGYNAEGFDFSGEMVNEAKRLGFKAFEANVEEDMGHDERYDKIICAGVLEFCRDDAKALMNLKNILKQGGVIALLIPCASFAGLLYRGFHRFFGCGEKVNLYSMAGVYKLAKACGLDVCGILRPVPHSLAIKLCKN